MNWGKKKDYLTRRKLKWGPGGPQIFFLFSDTLDELCKKPKGFDQIFCFTAFNGL